MSPEIKRWWNDNKIIWYERASKYSSFHKELALKLSQIIDKDERIIEVGCGLGYLAFELYSIGYEISAYDIDEDVIMHAKERTGLGIYHIGNCYKLNSKSDVVISCFFGNITNDDNFKSLSNLAYKEIIYVTGGGSARHIPIKEIEDFLKSKDIPFEISTITIPFHQPLNSDEIDLFLNTYYKGQILIEKRKKIKKIENNDYGYILENNKEITIFRINLRRKTV